MEEEWREIPGYPKYEINKSGEVRSWKRFGLKPMTLKQTKDRNNLMTVSLCNKGIQAPVTVGKLMRLAWMPEKEGIVYHINGINDDNRLENLGVMSRTEYMRQVASKNETHKQPVAKIDRSGAVVKTYSTIVEAAKANYVSIVTVRRRCEGQVKKEYAFTGYSFRYLRELKGEENGK